MSATDVRSEIAELLVSDDELAHVRARELHAELMGEPVVKKPEAVAVEGVDGYLLVERDTSFAESVALTIAAFCILALACLMILVIFACAAGLLG